MTDQPRAYTRGQVEAALEQYELRTWTTRVDKSIDDYWRTPIRSCLVGGCTHLSRANRRGYCVGHQTGVAA